MDFLEKLRNKVDELVAKDEIQLVHFNLFKGINEKDIDKAEVAVGYPIDAELKKLYLATNGLQLAWCNKKNNKCNELNKSVGQAVEWMYMRDFYHDFDGVIQILPFDRVFFYDWKNVIWFESEAKYDTSFKGHKMEYIEFKKMLRPFDFFSKYYCVVLLNSNFDNELFCVLGQDHEADFQSSKLLKVDNYFDLLVATAGDIKKRVKALESEWGTFA